MFQFMVLIEVKCGQKISSFHFWLKVSKLCQKVRRTSTDGYPIPADKNLKVTRSQLIKMRSKLFQLLQSAHSLGLAQSARFLFALQRQESFLEERGEWFRNLWGECVTFPHLRPDASLCWSYWYIIPHFKDLPVLLKLTISCTCFSLWFRLRL